MKNLKKILSVVLVLSLVFCFAACGKDNGANSSAPDKENESKTEVKTVNAGKLTMGTNAHFQPYEYYEGEKIIGIDAEIAGAIAKKLGLELQIDNMEFSSIITAVNAKSIDFGMAGMTVTEARLKDVDFSTSYASGVQSVIVKEGSPIKTVDDLSAEGSKYKIGVQLGTTGDIYATDDFGKDRVLSYNHGNEAVAALIGGSIDCVIIDNEPAKAFVANNEGLKILDTSYADEDYAICFAKDNTQLKDAVNKAIAELTEDGTIDSIIAKYIK